MYEVYSTSCCINWLIVQTILIGCYTFVLFSLALQPSAGYGLLVTRGFLITQNDAGCMWQILCNDSFMESRLSGILNKIRAIIVTDL
jgi:hypothetical protein